MTHRQPRRDRYGYLIPSSCRYPGALVCPCDFCNQDPDEAPPRRRPEPYTPHTARTDEEPGDHLQS